MYPLLGLVAALALLRREIRAKGLLAGSLETALNATPYIGAVKNAVELVTGDLIRDRGGAGR
jgi:hypothetical protein